METMEDTASPQIQIYTADDGRVQLEIKLEQETLWLTQAQIATLFEVRPQNITMHFKNIFLDGELSEGATCKESLQVQMEGGREVKRKRKLYNLDAVISVGYRINSSRATQFRIWATNTLKQHLVQGYTINQRRLLERGIEVDQALQLLSRTLSNQALIQPDGEAVVGVITDYARSWSLLQGYDEQSLKERSQKQEGMQPLDLDTVLAAISQLKAELIRKGEATELFGQLRGEGLESAIATIEQGFGDELFYPNVASRAAHLLYFVIMYRMYCMQWVHGCAGTAKNHPLADGNKRSGSFLFLWYLRLNQHLLAKPVEKIVNDNTLVALALLIAESAPEQKELMIRLVEHFIELKE